MRYYFTAKQVKVGYQKQPLIEKIEISLEKGKILTIMGCFQQRTGKRWMRPWKWYR